MIKILEQAVEKVRALSEERQAAAAEALELIAAQTDDAPLSADEVAGVVRAREAVERGEIADDADVREFFARHNA